MTEYYRLFYSLIIQLNSNILDFNKSGLLRGCVDYVLQRLQEGDGGWHNPKKGIVEILIKKIRRIGGREGVE